MREFSPNLTHTENFVIKVDAKLQLDRYKRTKNESVHYPSTKSNRVQAFLSKLREEEAPKLVSMIACNNSAKNTTERLWEKKFVEFCPTVKNQNNIIANYSSIFNNNESIDLMRTYKQRIQKSTQK